MASSEPAGAQRLLSAFHRGLVTLLTFLLRTITLRFRPSLRLPTTEHIGLRRGACVTTGSTPRRCFARTIFARCWRIATDRRNSMKIGIVGAGQSAHRRSCP